MTYASELDVLLSSHCQVFEQWMGDIRSAFDLLGVIHELTAAYASEDSWMPGYFVDRIGWYHGRARPQVLTFSVPALDDLMHCAKRSHVTAFDRQAGSYSTAPYSLESFHPSNPRSVYV